MKIFVTATNTGIGKTHTTLRLLSLVYRYGMKPGVMKPIETGVVGSPEDSSKLFTKCQEFNEEFLSLTLSDIVPYTFSLPAAPFVAKGDEKIAIDKIIEKMEELHKRCDILFIEGAGGLMVPIEKDFYMIDLIKAMEARALLVTPSYLGCINETLLSMEALERRDIAYDWYINLFQNQEQFYETTYPFYEAIFQTPPLDLESIAKSYVHLDTL